MSSSPPQPSSTFTFSCRCLNVIIEGRVPLDLERRIRARPKSDGKGELVSVWIEWAEITKQPVYVSFDQSESPSLKRTSSGSSGEDESSSVAISPCWRVCWVCGVKIYQTEGKRKDDSGIEKQWVQVDLNGGIRYGAEFDAIQEQTNQSFSSLLIEIPQHTSSFGRPPSSPHHVNRTAHLLPPLPDPFFLPPPFIPSHPHLRDLCNQAISRLRDCHSELEADVRAYAEKKAKEMKVIEDDVRAEVEYLWEKYRDGPGREDGLRRTRSRSLSLSGSKELNRTNSQGKGFTTNGAEFASVDDSSPSSPSPGPSANVSSASLLSASLSARTFHAPRPAQDVTSEDPVAMLTRTASKVGGDKDLAASYMLSTLETNKGNQSKQRKRSVSREGVRRVSSPVKETAEDEGEQDEAELEIEAEAHQRDSWIGMEKQEARRMMADGRDEKGNGEGKRMEVVEEEGEGRTPRPRGVKELNDDKKGKTKSRVVKFQEPQIVRDSRDTGDEDLEDDVGEEQGETSQEDYVFDFEIEDVEHPAKSSIPPPKPSRSRNMVEANLSSTFAADAPSHRAAWRKIEANESMYTALKRESSYTRVISRSTEDDDDDDDGDDDEGTSGKRGSASGSGSRGNMARSMPVNIVLPKRRRRENLPEFERKTSLTDRTGILVPPLRAAMRSSNSNPNSNSNSDSPSLSTSNSKPTTGNSLGLEVSPSAPANSFGGRRPSIPTSIPRPDIVGTSSVGGPGMGYPRRGSRSASVSREREREQVRGYEGDPGGVFETLADGVLDEDEEEDGDEDEDEVDVEGRRGGVERSHLSTVVEAGGMSVGVESRERGRAKGKSTFVPPHILAGRNVEGLEVGWRSLAS